MNKTTQKEIYLHYKGVILYDTIGELIGELKELMFERKIKQTVYKKVLMVMIEALENVFKYSDCFMDAEEITEDFHPEIFIAKTPTAFKITVSNPVKYSDQVSLEAKLIEINSLDKQGIKNKYKQIITNGEFSEKGGAGLGIIEMAKITDAPLDYSFTKINDQFSYYSLSLKIFCD